MAGNKNSGPRPSPTKVKLLHGERHRDRLNFDEPDPRNVLPIPPSDVDDEVREVWDRIVRELSFMGLAHAPDADALHCYCEAVVNHRKASRTLKTEPILVKSKYNTWMKNPALAVQREAANAIRQFAQEFGLTPSARSTISVKGLKDDTDENPFAASG